MTLPKSLSLFDDCRETLDEALGSGELEINCEIYARAVVFRRRCNHFRKLDRELNAEIYPQGDPRAGRSVYDTLELSIPKSPRDHLVVIRTRYVGRYQTGPIGTFPDRSEGKP